MAHALRRISYATCNPNSSKFAFLAREANCKAPCQYCHIFATETQFLAEELNTIIGDAFKLAYAKQQHSFVDAQLPTLSSLHPVELVFSSPSPRPGKHCVAPPLHIPPPPPTTPPFSILSSVTPLSRTCQENREDVDHQCNGLSNKFRPASSGLRRHWLRVEGEGIVEVEGETNEESVQTGSEHGGVAVSGLRSPCPRLLRQPQIWNSPKARHSVAFFDTPSPATPKFSALQSPSLQVPPLSIPTTPISIKDKHRAIFDLPFDDHPLTTVATNPVVALKTHLDSLANKSKKTPSEQTPCQKKPESSFPSSGNAVVSRFRLRQGVGGGGISGRGGVKKRQLERPLSQIICHLDSALLLNNSPSFNVQPRSEERLSVVEPLSNNHPTVAEEKGTDSDDATGFPRAAFQYLDDMEHPPIPPLRLHSSSRDGEEVLRFTFSHVSTQHEASRMEAGAQLQSLSESCSPEWSETGAEDCENDTGMEAAKCASPQVTSVATARQREVDVESMATTALTSQLNYQPADVCPVPPLLGSTEAWHIFPETSRSCPLHAGLETSLLSIHNDNSCVNGINSNQQLELQIVANSEWLGGQKDPQLTPKSLAQHDELLYRQMDRCSKDTPTPKATPTHTPAQSFLLPSQHPTSSWFQAYLPREVALEILTHEEAGSFLVRDSVTQPGCWALSVRVPTHVNCIGITHYLIQHSKHGVKLKGLDKEWPSLEALITHLTVLPEILPCPLRLPPTSHSDELKENHHQQLSNPIFTEEEEERNGATEVVGATADEEDEEYQRLSDFSSMLADMQPSSDMSHLFQ